MRPGLFNNSDETGAGEMVQKLRDILLWQRI